jgi:hypothetical protein
MYPYLTVTRKLLRAQLTAKERVGIVETLDD